MANMFDDAETLSNKSENLNFNVDPKLTKNIIEEIKHFQVRDSDIVLLGYPRCGTTWTQEMVWLIANDLDFEKAKIFIDERFPCLELKSFNLQQNPDIIIRECHSNSIEFVENMKDPRFYKSHVKPLLLPEQIRTGEVKPKIIYVTRNVKDACLSGYHYFKNVTKLYDNTLESFCEEFILHDDVMMGNYWESVLYFWERRNEDNILFIRYEEMKKDLLKEIRRVAKFLGKNLTEEQENKLLERLDFERIKKNPAVNHDDIYKKSGFIRVGKVGEHEKEMSSEIIEKFDNWSKEYLKNSDYVM